MDYSIISFPPGSTRVAACLEQVGQIVHRVCPPTIQVLFTIDEALPAVICDPEELATALLNLIFNACDAMPDGGSVRVRAQAWSDGALLAISVADAGIGMSADTISRALQHGFSTKPVGTGGHGLPMVDAFLRRAGGRIGIESRPHQGTTVTLLLPALSPS